jgi:hypothetical protein
VRAVPAAECYDGAESRNRDERTWDQRILDAVASGVDETLLESNLALTPTERVEQLQRVVDQLAAMRSGR